MFVPVWPAIIPDAEHSVRSGNYACTSGSISLSEDRRRALWTHIVCLFIIIVKKVGIL